MSHQQTPTVSLLHTQPLTFLSYHFPLINMPRVPSSASFSLACEDLRSPIECRAVAHFQEVNFTNNFNCSNTVRAHHGNQPYPRPRNIWIRALNVDNNKGFSDLYLKVCWQCLFFDLPSLTSSTSRITSWL